MAKLIDSNLFDACVKDEMASRLATIEKQARPMTFRQIVEELYQDIQCKIEGGFTIREIYTCMLTDELKEKIAYPTFSSYYYKARKKVIDREAQLRRTASRAAAREKANNEDNNVAKHEAKKEDKREVAQTAMRRPVHAQKEDSAAMAESSSFDVIDDNY